MVHHMVVVMVDCLVDHMVVAMVDHMVDHMVVDRLGKNGLEDDDKVGLINWVNHFKC